MKLALVYDRVNKIGGAERVLEALHRLYPKAPLHTAVYNPATAPWANDIQVIPSFLNRLPFLKTRHELLPLVTPYAFESFDLHEYDVIISVTSADAKSVITSPRQLHICYLLTPTRYLWSHAHDYTSQGLKGAVLKRFLPSLKRWDYAAAQRPDVYVAISQHVADRCEAYYDRQPEAVIYPPVNTNYFETEPDEPPEPPEPPYFLTVSRLVPYKRVDLAIKACNSLKQPLVVVGTGSELPRLKKIAGPTISFVGAVSDQKLNSLYHRAKALIFPQEEEFGISAIEAQAAGIPVIAFKKGSAPEIIKDGVTGILFNSQTVGSLSAALATFNSHTWYDKTIQEHARRFSGQKFTETFKSLVEDLWQKKQHHE